MSYWVTLVHDIYSLNVYLKDKLEFFSGHYSLMLMPQ